jgi:cysteinyl-tRNA synthetase
LQQDLDTPRALQKLRSLEKSEEVTDATKYQIFFKVDQILGLNLFKQIDQKVASSDQLQLLDKRAAARQQGDYEESDRLRELLQEQGIAVKDSKEGQSWEWII